MSKPETMMIDDVKYVREDSIKPIYEPRKEGPWEIGKAYFVRTVTMAIHGVLVEVTPQELVFIGAAWISDTGRFHQFITGKSDPSEIEPFLRESAVIVGRGALVDAVRMPSRIRIEIYAEDD
jgi:hypothetical protein